MKFLLNRLVVFIILFLCSTTTLMAKELKAVYKIEVGTINIGSLSWSIDIVGNNYKTSLLLKDKGLISGFYKFIGQYFSEGKIFEDEFISYKYKQIWKTKKKTRKVEIIFDEKKMVSSMVLSPQEKEHSRIEYLNVQGLIDPLSSFLNILVNSSNNYKTIDGRRLYKMSLDFNKSDGALVSKKIIINDYFNIWADHKKKDLKSITIIQNTSNKDSLFPINIKIKNKGLIFKLTKI